MAFLRTVPRCCVGSKKFRKCLPLSTGPVENSSRPTVQLVQVLARGYTNSSTSASTTEKPATSVPRQIDPLDLKFNDPVASFKSKTTTELIRAYIVYQICSIEYIVENNMKVSTTIFSQLFN